MNTKHALALHLCIITAVTTHAMENQQQNTATTILPDYNLVEKALWADYTHYLQKNLQEYKTMDKNFNDLAAMAKVMTGNSHLANTILGVHDGTPNFFIHEAVEKKDLAGVEWLYYKASSSNQILWNKDRKTPFDLCIEQLSPWAHDDTKSISFDMLRATICYIQRKADQGYHDVYKKECLKKLIDLGLIYKKRPVNTSYQFNIYLSVMRDLIPKANRDDKPCLLTTLFQQAAYEQDGSTFTHLMVEYGEADKILKWIRDGRISFLKNKAGQTPLDLAYIKFSQFTHNMPLATQDPEGFKNAQCCLFTLLNYAQSINNDVDAEPHFCCNKHVIK